MKKTDSRINCPTFQRQEPLVEDITAKINNAKGVSEKTEFAEKLQKELDVLLCCPDYKKKDKDCSNCRFITNVRQKTADLVIEAKKLA
jgi:hypothetical protein